MKHATPDVPSATPKRLDDLCKHLDGKSAVVAEQTAAMAAMFRAIERLSEDSVIRELCRHGALTGDLACSDLEQLGVDALGGFIHYDLRA